MKRLVTALVVPVALAFCMGAAWAGAPSPDALLSNADRRHQEQALQNALEFNRTGEAELWESLETGHWGTVTPTLTYRNAAGQDCRKFEREVFVDNRQAQVWGTRCRTAAGAWHQPVAPKPVYTRVYKDRRHYPRPNPYHWAAPVILFYGIRQDRPRRFHRHDRLRRHDRLHRQGRSHRHDRLNRRDRADRHDRLQRRGRSHRHDRFSRHDRPRRHDRADRRRR
ncbi:MAG: hypothetical protein OXF11_17140 [Deltaproteobacteria bacterium]|nr:hypothetical protein [Deltaproteobacteria bacterium]